jgi:phospholipase/lecithinase/hemolysin
MRRTILAALAVAALGTGSAHGYSNLFAFGDSLSDGGNAFALTSAANSLPPLHWPPSPPAAQRFSNGPTAVEVLAASGGLLLTPSRFGGTNYAYGGATTGDLNFNAAVGSPAGLPASMLPTGMGSTAQVGQFLAAPPAFNPADTLFFLWGGPNDLLLASALSNNDPAAVAAAAHQAVLNLAGLAGMLFGAGARNFLVPNMPNLGVTPYGLSQGPLVAAGLTALAQGFNAGLGTAMAQVDALPGVTMTVFDTFAFFDGVRMNPGAFGFTNVDQPCLASLSALAGGCGGYLFFDELHPTGAAHAVLANAFEVALIPEPETWAMLAAGLVVLAIAVRRRRLA